MENKKVEYKSNGVVFGNYWGGGKGAYKARSLEADTLETLLALNEQGIADGSLDAGMGYESLIGGFIEVTTTTTIDIEGKPFVNEECENHWIGNISEEDADFVEDCFYRT